MTKKSYIVLFTDEDEIYGPDAFEDGRIPAFGTASCIVIQNNSEVAITVGIANETITAYEGFMLAARDANIPGGHIMLDLRSNKAAVNRIRGYVHGGGAGNLSFTVI